MLSILTVPCLPDNGCSLSATPYFNVRSQGVNIVRDMVGWEHLINRCDKEHWYGGLAATFEFDDSFKPHQIAHSLFGNDVCCTKKGGILTISGSRATDRGTNDWLADYFALPTDFKSIIIFKPKINNFIADIGFYLGLDEWADNLYVRFNVPLVHTQWNLNFCECVIDPGVNDIAQGYYFNPIVCPTSRALLFPNATAFFCGGTINTIEPLRASKWPCGCDNTVHNLFAAVNAVFGWNFACCENYRIGLNVRVSAPTGNRPTGEYLFEPIVGNGHHWELGMGFSTYFTLWGNDCGDTLGFYCDGNLTHLFKTCQTRTFDLCGKPNSRYMLAQNMGPNLENLSGCPSPSLVTVCAFPALSNNQFADVLTSVANLTRVPVKVSIDLQTDIAFKFAYETYWGLQWDLGYNFWSRSCERIYSNCNSSKHPLADGKSWALKGDATVVGFGTLDQVAHELAATESNATIHAGTNGFVPGNDITNALALQNPGVDNPQFAVTFTEPLANAAVTLPINTSIQPIYLTEADIDYAGTQGISHKVFTHVSYTWDNPTKNYQPFLGLGASAEFAQQGTKNKHSCCSNCHDSGLSQWGVWIKFGLAFDICCNEKLYEQELMIQEKKSPLKEKETIIKEKQTIVEKKEALLKKDKNTVGIDIDTVIEIIKTTTRESLVEAIEKTLLPAFNDFLKQYHNAKYKEYLRCPFMKLELYRPSLP